jgi:hypothetical protein
MAASRVFKGRMIVQTDFRFVLIVSPSIPHRFKTDIAVNTAFRETSSENTPAAGRCLEVDDDIVSTTIR